MDRVVSCLKQAEKMVGSRGLLQDGPSAACVDLVNSATKSQAGAAHLHKSKPELGFGSSSQALLSPTSPSTGFVLGLGFAQ